jgi:hypothetical protein
MSHVKQVFLDFGEELGEIKSFMTLISRPEVLRNVEGGLVRMNRVREMKEVTFQVKKSFFSRRVFTFKMRGRKSQPLHNRVGRAVINLKFAAILRLTYIDIIQRCLFSSIYSSA